MKGMKYKGEGLGMEQCYFKVFLLTLNLQLERARLLEQGAVANCSWHHSHTQEEDLKIQKIVKMLNFDTDNFNPFPASTLTFYTMAGVPTLSSRSDIQLPPIGKADWNSSSIFAKRADINPGAITSKKHFI